MFSFEELMKEDPQIAEAIEAEVKRQNSHIELIASENWVSHAVMAAMGSPLTNKYAEGYPGKRYYGGCEFVDVVENLARDRAMKLFISRKKQLTYNDTSAHDRAFLILHRCTAPSFRIGRNFACVLFFTLFY